MAGQTNFPGSVDSHTGGNPFGFAEVGNLIYTRLTAAATAAATTLTVASTTGFATRGIVIVGLETITYTGTTSTTFTGCTRAAGGTTAAACGIGAIVGSAPVAANLNDHSAAIVAIENVLSVMPGQPIVINGNMDHFQRVGSSAQTSTTTYSQFTNYAADRIFVLPAGASVTQQRSTTVPDTKSLYSNAITGAASVTTVDIGQRVEAAIVNTRCRQSLVFSCYVRNESGAAFTPNLRIGTPSASDNFTTVTNRLDQALQSCADSAWTRVYHVFDPSAYTNLANGMEVCLRVPSGSLVSGDTVRISQFDVRPGIALAAYAPPDPVLTLLLCRRYFRSYGGGTFETIAIGTQTANNTGLFGLMHDTAPMRSAQTFSYTAFSDWSIVGYTGGGANVITGWTAYAGGPGAHFFYGGVAGTPFTPGTLCLLQANNTSARIYLGAEL